MNMIQRFMPDHSISPRAADLAAIYRNDINMAVWQNALGQSLDQTGLQQLQDELPLLLQRPGGFRFQLHSRRKQFRSQLQQDFPSSVPAGAALLSYLDTAAEVFESLFEPNAMALRLITLDGAMCPRFHVDHVPVRLVSSISGPGTEWLPETAIKRQALGGGPIQPCQDDNAILRAVAGDLALMKGEGWIGNEGRGLVHRSPATNEPRLFLSIDFAAG
ncbi:DUF1826 domain-containing protein [Oceanobacter mangrovi]|uniref:DUF1826 domain-containing protein n=1 Tax=Oceanobacter mangrovi TaxID=2862510 RepID=UPI001C8EBCB0|nr:DUF1826 domain-containing protein [Oceanobacter mangrovi]